MITMGLRTYVLRRCLQYIPLIFIVSVVTYSVVRAAPGDPIRNIYGLVVGRDYDPKDIERIREKFGLNDPIHIQYLRWLGDFLQGNLGYSYKHHQPVASMVMFRILNTFKLQLSSLAISTTLSIIVGVVSAVRRYTKIDKALLGSALFFWSMPTFWFALMMILIFSVNLGLFPTHGLQTNPGTTHSMIDEIYHLILPVVTLGLSMIGYFSRLVRAEMLEVLSQDYIMTARAKGLKEKVVIYRHALRNVMLPIVTVLGLYFAWVFTGSAVIETVFAIPGVGSLMVEASYMRDYAVIMGITMTVTIATTLSILTTDIIYAYLDPRIRY